MATSFDPALSTPRDWLRFQLGDTNVYIEKADDADPLTLPVDDAVYDGVLARHSGDERLSAIYLSEAFIAKYAQMPNQAAITNVKSAEWRYRLDAWKALSARLRAEIATEASVDTAIPSSPRGTVAVPITSVW